MTMYCTKCAIYSTTALTQAWQMIVEYGFIGNQVTYGCVPGTQALTYIFCTDANTYTYMILFCLSFG